MTSGYVKSDLSRRVADALAGRDRERVRAELAAVLADIDAADYHAHRTIRLDNGGAACHAGSHARDAGRDPRPDPKRCASCGAGHEAERDRDKGDSLQTVLDSVKDAILTLSVDGHVISANTSAARVFGVATPALMSGRDAGDLIPLLNPAAQRLAGMAEPADDTITNLAPRIIEARRDDGHPFSAEITVSRIVEGGHGECFLLCLRDVTDRLNAEQALRDSEARTRALVENAPEAIVVLDVDLNRFVDANRNAVQLFGLSGEQLMEAGPDVISPPRQSDGLPSQDLHRGYVDRALQGGRPVFEWLYRHVDGREIPCEVRMIRLPSTGRRLVRASITDIAARRRSDALAHGERRVLELIASNSPLDRTLQAVTRAFEQVCTDLFAVISLLENADGALRLTAWGSLPESLRPALAELPVGVGTGGCGATASLGRQVVIRNVAEDELAGNLREPLLEHGIHAVVSTPIVTSGDRLCGTLAVYCTSSRGPTTEELDLISRLTQLAGIAIRRRQDQDALAESEARFRALFDNVVDGVYQSTPEGELISANPALVRMLGFVSVDELAAHGGLAGLFADRHDRERLLAELNTLGRVRNFEYRLRRRDGFVITALENSRVVYDDAGHALYHEGMITDISQRKAAEKALFNEKERAEVTLKSIGDAVVTTDADGLIEYLNPVAEQLCGWERRQAQGRAIEEVIVLCDEEAGRDVEVPIRRCLQEGRVVGLEDNVVLIARDGTRVAIQDSAAPILDRSGRVVGAVMVFHDVSRERQLHRKLAYYASHDSLTGLINRREFEERLSSALKATREDPQRGSALLYMDLDQFKVVNDTCGHAAGDLLLRQLGDLLQTQVPSEDALARLGGDEFAVLLSDCTVERAIEVAEVLRETIARFRFSWRDGAMQVGVSIGIVTVKPPLDSIATLMSAADVACYVAKDLGRNRIHVYEEGDAAERHQEMQWVARINRAREQERFELFYQPIVPIGATRDAWPQYELLLRMRDEKGELVPTTTFIPAAERYNLMPSLDRWVISHVLEELIYRDSSGSDPYMLALNLSGTTLNDAKFIDFLLNELTAAGAPAGALCFEITETAAIANLGQVVRFMNMLREYGVRFSLDDFGTGLSSLTYLKNLPVDFVKIDGAFIRNVTRDPVDQSMVEAITQMARALKVHTIAERVESRAVLTKLGEIGVTFAQGYFVAVPQPVTELPLQRHQTLVADAVAEADLFAAAAAAAGSRTDAAATTVGESQTSPSTVLSESLRAGASGG